MTKKKKVVFLVPYPLDEAPSQRFRFEQYFSVLAYAGINYSVYSFYSLSLWRVMYTPGGLLQKAWGVTWSLIKRWQHLLKALSADFVFVHREITPLGPPVFEFLLAKVFRKKLIYDFDDAIWLTDEKARLSNTVRCFWKVKHICRWSYKVSCGNEYLGAYAKRWNSSVFINPTTIDTCYHFIDTIGRTELSHGCSLTPGTHLVQVGWTGSHSTLKYLDGLIPILKKFENEIELVVICNEDPQYNLKNYRFIKWSKETEVTALQKIDLGIMPLPEDLWAEGKCGFKALQYFGVGKPVIASPVGVNKKIVQHGINGFLASTEQEWEDALTNLIGLGDQWNRMGLEGRILVEKEYSITSNQALFLSLFE